MARLTLLLLFIAYGSCSYGQYEIQIQDSNKLVVQIISHDDKVLYKLGDLDTLHVAYINLLNFRSEDSALYMNGIDIRLSDIKMLGGLSKSIVLVNTLQIMGGIYSAIFKGMYFTMWEQSNTYKSALPYLVVSFVGDIEMALGFRMAQQKVHFNQFKSEDGFVFLLKMKK